MTLPTSNLIVESQGNITFVQQSTLLPVLYNMPFDACRRLYCKKRSFIWLLILNTVKNSRPFCQKVKIYMVFYVCVCVCVCVCLIRSVVRLKIDILYGF